MLGRGAGDGGGLQKSPCRDGIFLSDGTRRCIHRYPCRKRHSEGRSPKCRLRLSLASALFFVLLYKIETILFSRIPQVLLRIFRPQPWEMLYGAGTFFGVQDWPVHCEVFSSILTSTCRFPEAAPLPLPVRQPKVSPGTAK